MMHGQQDIKLYNAEFRNPTIWHTSKRLSNVVTMVTFETYGVEV